MIEDKPDISAWLACVQVGHSYEYYRGTDPDRCTTRSSAHPASANAQLKTGPGTDDQSAIAPSAL